ncbi:MAG: hypothetical protein WCF18_16500 [Chthoniobacteraceae bacterium]
MLRFLRKSIPLKRFVGDLPVIGKRFRNWMHYQHPFDREFGVETSGFVPSEEIERETGRSGMVPYAGTHPSSVRRILERLPDPETFTLVDLGCGKGRILAVASEFPLCRIIGVELTPSLAACARRNGEIIAAKFPQRTRIEVFEGDVLTFVPEERVIFFNYHAFSRELLAQVIAGLENQLGRQLSLGFFAYLNPVCADLLDRSARWSRWCAETVPHGKGELGFGFGERDSIVAWQSVPNAYPPLPGAGRRVIIKDPLWNAELEPATGG